jgi:hypothetical protein
MMALLQRLTARGKIQCPGPVQNSCKFRPHPVPLRTTPAAWNIKDAQVGQITDERIP